MAAQARHGAHGVVQSAWQRELTKREVSELWRGIARVRKLHCINTPSPQKTTIALFFTYRREKTFCTRSPFVHNILRQKAFIVPHCKIFILRQKAVIVLMNIRYFYIVKGELRMNAILLCDVSIPPKWYQHRLTVLRPHHEVFLVVSRPRKWYQH
jgi:hypothetical protein